MKGFETYKVGMAMVEKDHASVHAADARIGAIADGAKTDVRNEMVELGSRVQGHLTGVGNQVGHPWAV